MHIRPCHIWGARAEDSLLVAPLLVASLLIVLVPSLLLVSVLVAS